MRIFIDHQNRGFQQLWVQALSALRVDIVRGYLANHVLDRAFLEGLDGVMWHIPMSQSRISAAKNVLNTIEFHYNTPVFPNWQTRWHFQDKAAQYQLLAAKGFPMPETEVFYSATKARNYLASSPDFPLVWKLKYGAGSSGIRLLKNMRSAKRALRRIFSPSGYIRAGYHSLNCRSPLRIIWRCLVNMLIRIPQSAAFLLSGRYPFLPKNQWMPEKDVWILQEFLPGNSFDIRVTVIGERAFVFTRRNRPGDFRASGSGRLEYDRYEEHLDCVEIAFAVSRTFGFQSMAYDFLRDMAGKPKIIEFCFGFNGLAVYNCPGFWNIKNEWVPGRFVPEELQVNDFLEGI